MLGWGRIRTPLIPQMEAAECGAASLGIVLAHFGLWVPIAELRQACGVNRDGSSAASLVRAGARYGLRIRGWRKEVDSLSDLQLPAILFWEFNHFLVLESIRGQRYHLNDPANGRRTVSRETFGESFTGVALTAERTPEFRPGGDPPNIWKALWPWLKEARAGLLFVALAGLFLAIPGLALPVLLNLFVDEALGAGQRQWGLWMAAAVALSGVAVYLLTWLQQMMLRKIGIQLAVVNSQRLLWRIFRLPTQFFNARFAGDLVSRVSLVDQIAAGASSQFVGLLVQLVISLLLLCLLIIYDPVIAGAVALIAAVNLLAVRWISRWRTDENRQLRREQALLFGTEEVGLRQIDLLRATAREDDFFVRWSGYQARELAARQHFVELGYVIGRLPGFFMLLGGMAVIGLGGIRVIEDDLTVGGLIAVYTLTGSFLAPLGRFANSVDAFQLLEADMQRVADIMGADEDALLGAGLAAADTNGVASLNGQLRLAGHLELRDITFGYQSDGPPLIDGLSLTVAPGQRIAVVGPTGSGKSTLLSLVSGEHRPWSGSILFDGAPVTEIPRTVFTASVATVDQQIVLFDGTVRDNLTMWNSVAEEQEIIAAARDAHIHDEIMSRVGGYESHVQEGGRNFSGGQRQRLEIARALVQRPSLLLLDEATSNLDAVTEQQIDDALRRRGCSCLIVAHRLSTIRDCDQIIVLNRGRETQRGTHEELMADPDGVYASWVQSQ